MDIQSSQYYPYVQSYMYILSYNEILSESLNILCKALGGLHVYLIDTFV